MAGIAKVSEIVDPRALVDGRSGRPRRVPKAIQELIRLCLSGEVKTIAAAAGRVGLNSSYVYRSLKLPHVRKHISEQTRGKLDEGTVLAAGRLVGLINAKSEHVSLDASRHALALSGYTPPQDGRGINITLNNNIAAGYVVDLSPQGPVIEHDEQ